MSVEKVRRETSKMFRHYSLRKQLKRVPRFSRLTVEKTATLLHFWRHPFNMGKFFQTGSTAAGFDKLCV